MRFPALLVFISCSAIAADWPQFLGPQRNGVADKTEPALPDTFPGDLTPLWKKSVGAGFAGPVVVGGQVIIIHRESSDMTTEALDAKTGQPAWRTVYTTDYIDSFGFDNGPRAVPAIADGRVFTFGPEGRATAMDLKTGKELWHYDTAAALGSEQGFFGRTPSPLVTSSEVIFAPGGHLDGKPAGLIALNSETGKSMWTAVDDAAGCSSPVLAAEGGIVVWMRNRLWDVGLTRKVTSSLPLRSSMDASVNAATPVDCGGGRYFVSAGYGVGAHLIQIGNKGFETVWKKEDTLDCHYATPVRVGDHLYGFHGRQESGMNLRCIEIATGKVAWEDPDGVPGGTLIAVGDKLLVVTERGELWIVRATPEKFQQLAAIQILRAGHRSHAAYSDGILYARDSEHLIALKLR